MERLYPWREKNGGIDIFLQLRQSGYLGMWVRDMREDAKGEIATCRVST
jgi:hypothetical protein